MSLTAEQLLHMFRQMLTIRSFEAHIREQWKADLITGSTHTYIGQEAVGVGVCAALRPADYITSTHRGHGHCIAKGGDVRKMMAELMGKYEGYCHGKGGSMHIADIDIGMLGASGIVGGGIPMAVGAGLSAKKRGTDQVTVAFFGEGATNQGSWHEAMNLASTWKVPTVFVCENNLYAITTSVTKVMNIQDIATRAISYGIPGAVVDGMDVFAVYDAVSQAVERARQGEGPTLIECKTYRYQGHWIGDDASYRSREEFELWQAKDPIPNFERRLMEMGVLTSEKVEEIKAQVEKELDEAVEFGKAASEPPAESLYEGLYA